MKSFFEFQQKISDKKEQGFDLTGFFFWFFFKSFLLTKINIWIWQLRKKTDEKVTSI